MVTGDGGGRNDSSTNNNANNSSLKVLPTPILFQTLLGHLVGGVTQQAVPCAAIYCPHQPCMFSTELHLTQTCSHPTQAYSAKDAISHNMNNSVFMQFITTASKQ